MPKQKFIDQSAKDLNLTIVENKIEKPDKLFTILKSKNFTNSNYIINAHIIGTSHIIQFASGDFILYEIVACQKIKSELTFPLNKLNSEFILNYSKRFFKGKYNFTHNTLNWEKGESELKKLEKSANSCNNSEIGLIHDFPKKKNQETPQTIIHVNGKQSKSVTITTAHSYPQENTIVFTKTILKIK